MIDKILQGQKEVMRYYVRGNLSMEEIFFTEPVFEAVRQFCALAFVIKAQSMPKHELSDIRKSLYDALFEWLGEKGLMLKEMGMDEDSEEFRVRFSIYVKIYYLAKNMIYCAGSIFP